MTPQPPLIEWIVEKWAHNVGTLIERLPSGLKAARYIDLTAASKINPKDDEELLDCLYRLAAEEYETGKRNEVISGRETGEFQKLESLRSPLKSVTLVEHVVRTSHLDTRLHILRCHQTTIIIPPTL